MWSDNFQKFNEVSKPIISDEIIQKHNNGRVNLFDNSSSAVDKRIKMFERSTPSIKASTDYRNALSTILAESKISNMFFSSKNIQYIQDTLKNQVYKRSNGRYKLLPQNEDDLKVIMRAYFLQYIEHRIGYETEELKRLNGLVLDFLVPRMMNESESYEKYIRDQSTLVMPFDRAVQVDRDWKELKYQPFMNEWI
jgi:hypothetical protein